MEVNLFALIHEIKNVLSEKDYNILKGKFKQTGLSLYFLHKLIEKKKDPIKTYKNRGGFIIINEVSDCGNCEKLNSLNVLLETNIANLGEKTNIQKRKKWIIRILVIFVWISFMVFFRILQVKNENIDYYSNKIKTLEQANESLTSKIGSKDSLLNQIINYSVNSTGYDIEDVNIVGYSAWIMWFRAEFPLTIANMKTMGDSSGEITIKLYNENDSLIQSKDVKIYHAKKTISVSLNFSIPQKGDYYFSFSSKDDVNLGYSKGNSYNFPNNGYLKILGTCSNNDKKKEKKNNRIYYDNFYNIEYHLNDNLLKIQ